jgi:Domain of unknown function (DUF4124)
MKKAKLAFFLIITLMLALPVSAEIYKYVDENGQKRWTDDLSQVPKEQRPSAQHFESVEETPVETAAAPTDEIPPESPAETEEMGTATPMETETLSRDALEKEKADLDAQYQQLIEERKQLEQIKATANTTETRAALNERISAYNDKTEQYETKLDNFNEKINNYNQNIISKKPSQTE